MPRHRRNGRSCKFESLEKRNLLAGDVTASIRNGDLVIKGDDLANGITITAGATAGTVVITGVNAGGSATNVNGTANGVVTLSGFTDDLKISMKDGDDTVSITNLDIPDSAKIKGGDGNDTITIDGATIDDKLKIRLSDGDDSLSITDTEVTGKTKIKGKDGDDDVTIEGSTFTRLRVKLGQDDDTLDISGTTASVKTRLNGGRGTNTFTSGTGNSLTNLKEKNFDDDDETSSSTSPTLAISGAATTNEGALYTLNLSSTGTGGDTITQWTITWGDGSAAQVVTGDPSSVTHTYTDGAATRTISATATNPNGTFNAGNTVSVTVNNVVPTLSISGALSVNEGEVYTLNLTDSDPGADAISQWTINWGDGSAVQTVTGNPASVTHTFADGPATRTISATATDEDGTFNVSNTVAVTVNNVAHTASISGASSVNEGSVYTLNLSSTDPGADTISQWVINWGDGSAPQTVTGNPSSVTHTFTDGPATRTISATVTDDDGTTNVGNTVAVTVNNVARTASISGASSVNEGSFYTLNLSSTDPGADTVSQWVINWGDGSAAQTVTGNPASVIHIFTDGPNTRTISATVTDEDGTVNATNTVAVTVNNVSPTIAISGAASVNEGAEYTLNLSSTDPGADTVSQWVINWGDGSAAQTVTGNPASVTHTFTDGPATRTISATATDEDGTVNATNTVVVTVSNVAPTLTISGPASVNEGAVYTLNLSSTDPGPDTISQWTITWGDNTPAQVVSGNPASVTHIFADGITNVTISATATDEDGTFPAGNTVSVTVNNVAPTVDLNAVPSILENGTATLTGSFTDIGLSDAHTVSVNWGDPNNSTNSVFSVAATSGLAVSQTINSVPDSAVLTITAINLATGQVSFSVQHKYADDGLASGNATVSDITTIAVTVTDDDGQSGMSTRFITVSNTEPALVLGSVPDVSVGGTATLTGSYTDTGLVDAQTISVQWGDLSTGSTFAIPAVRNAAGTQTLSEGNTFNSTSDSAVLTVNSVNVATGQVSFSVSHQYAAEGTRTITVSLTDDDTGNDTESTTVNVTVIL